MSEPDRVSYYFDYFFSDIPLLPSQLSNITVYISLHCRCQEGPEHTLFENSYVVNKSGNIGDVPWQDFSIHTRFTEVKTFDLHVNLSNIKPMKALNVPDVYRARTLCAYSLTKASTKLDDHVTPISEISWVMQESRGSILHEQNGIVTNTTTISGAMPYHHFDYNCVSAYSSAPRKFRVLLMYKTVKSNILIFDRT